MTARRLDSIVSLQRGNTYKSKLLGDDGPRLLGLASIAKDGGFRGDNLKSYSGPTDPRHLVYPGDIYVSLKDVTQSGDLLGSAACVPEKITVGRLTQDTVKLVFKEDVSYRPYVYWALRTPQYRAYCRARAVGTTNLSLSREDFLSFTLPPLLPERELLVSLLQMLDDKIELNRRMAGTLEEMARALYRSWFVDFDPVRAREAGLAPAHMDPATAALFPDRFGPDGLPEGWRRGTLDDVIVFNPGEKLKKGVVAPYLDMKALPTAGAMPAAPYDRAFTSGTKFRSGDTLLARITPCLENGKTAIVPELGDGVVGWGSTEFIVMRGKAYDRVVLPYCVARDPEFREEAVGSMTGSSGRQRADASRLASLPFSMPKPRVIEAFEDMTKPWLSRIVSLNVESRTLAALRDALLPKLMSGELTVREAEAWVSEVA